MFLGGMDEDQDANEIAQQNGNQHKDDQVLSEYIPLRTYHCNIAFLHFVKTSFLHSYGGHIHLCNFRTSLD